MRMHKQTFWDGISRGLSSVVPRFRPAVLGKPGCFITPAGLTNQTLGLVVPMSPKGHAALLEQVGGADLTLLLARFEVLEVQGACWV